MGRIFRWLCRGSGGIGADVGQIFQALGGSRGSVTLEAAMGISLFMVATYILIGWGLMLQLENKLDQALFETALDYHFMIETRLTDGRAPDAALTGLRVREKLRKHLDEKQVGLSIGAQGIELAQHPTLRSDVFVLRAVARVQLPLLGALKAESMYLVGNNGDTLGLQDREVVVTPTGKRYHLPGCNTLNRSVHTRVLQEHIAWEEGYTPCKVCFGLVPGLSPH